MAPLCKASDDAFVIIEDTYLILLDLLNERVTEGEAFDPHDFTVYLATILTYSLYIPLHSVLQHINCCHKLSAPCTLLDSMNFLTDFKYSEF